MQKLESALTKPILICGPCAAESREQILSSAKELSLLEVKWLRAGIWKPRTRPSAFEGVGTKGLSWLKEAKDTYNINVCTEVAKSNHIEKCLKAGIDALWLGARTSSNPFSVEELAESLTGVKDTAIMIKNPMIPDVKLWLGAIERVEKHTGVTPIAIHRGFSLTDNTPYRQSPLWKIAFELKQLRKDIKIICDPSHIAGNRTLVKDIALQAANIGFDGLMIETHPSPENALTDTEQQLNFKELADLLAVVNFPDSNKVSNSLLSLRESLNETDKVIIEALARRMQLSESIAKVKQKENMTVFQANRWEEVLKTLLANAERKGLNKDFIKEIYEIIHQESIKIQNITIKKSRE